VSTDLIKLNILFFTGLSKSYSAVRKLIKKKAVPAGTAFFKCF
jgi:hypothetical protein